MSRESGLFHAGVAPRQYQQQRYLTDFVSYFFLISIFRMHSVLCGRGGETNHHAGNIRYRQLVKICQPAYIAAKRREKPKIAQRIVRAVRLLGGRFLKKIPEDNYWTDVGNVKAREKTSQALREGAPELRGGAGTDEERPKKRKTPTKPQGAAAQMMNVMLQQHPHHHHPHHHHPHHHHYGGMEVSPPPPAGVGSMFTYNHHPTQTVAAPQQPKLEQEHQEPPEKKQRISATSPAAVVEARASTPTGFSVTVSADDDDGAQTSPSSTVRSSSTSSEVRGPRLKLLKRRLQCSATAPTT